jgi:hypothetical protein
MRKETPAVPNIPPVKVVRFETVISTGPFPDSPTFERIQRELREAVDHVRWPKGAVDFRIYPQSGKKRSEGNGVKPIKLGFQDLLKSRGWLLEQRQPRSDSDKRKALMPGAFDAWVDLQPDGFLPFVAEWETGNISSSHRALNKMAIAMLERRLIGGVLVLPTRNLAQFLTDRVGNYEEIEPYLPLWRSLKVKGFLGLMAVEHDGQSWDVERIPKGSDGRAVG